MGFQFNRRINLGRGWSLTNRGNLSFRTRFGSIGTSGGSIRTGTPGLTYRYRFKKSDGTMSLLMLAFFIYVLPLILLVWLSFKILQLAIFLSPTIYEILKWIALTLYDLIKHILSELQNRRHDKQLEYLRTKDDCD